MRTESHDSYYHHSFNKSMPSSSSLSSSSAGSNGSITDANPSGDRAAHELAKLREDCHQVELQTAKFFQAVRDVPVVSGSDGKSKRIPKRDRKERVLDLSSQFYSIANGLHNACSKQAEQATRVLHSSEARGPIQTKASFDKLCDLRQRAPPTIAKRAPGRDVG